jgi:uncharacterized surface protein with fasciclin (FAS1) repeats
LVKVLKFSKGKYNMNIVETAINAGNFKTLVAAVQAAGLVDTLSGEGPFTVFAPTDEAFAKLPEMSLTGLMNNKEMLTKVLTYHVVPGKVMAAQVAGMMSATSLEGDTIKIQASDQGVLLNDKANVTATDIECSNGVIHVVDTVLRF